MSEVEKLIATLPPEHREFARKTILASPPVTAEQAARINARISSSRRRRAAQGRMYANAA